MPLDRTNGERIEGLEAPHVVVPNVKWRETDMFNTAATNAARAFMKAGYPIIPTFDDEQVLTQEYPTLGRLVFVFQMRIKGDEMLYPYVFALPPEMIANLRAAGQWSHPTDPIPQESAHA